MDAFTLAKSIVLKLNKAGFVAYFAGGWVRDYLMGHSSEDIDIATSAAPFEIMNLFPNTILVGLSFGVVIVVLEGHQFEVATFRKDLKYVDGRHPTGIEMSNPKEDALRRDFTINGMFYDPINESIHDFVQGQEDIKHQMIRTIGDPEERFFEDRLRMLRAFRFASRFGFTIHSDTQTAILDNADKLFPAVAMERVLQEFNKMSAYPGFDRAIIDMHRLSILEIIFPELQGAHLNELRERVKVFASLPKDTPTIVYLMELFPDMSPEAKIRICKRLRVKNKDIQFLGFLDKLFTEIHGERQGNSINFLGWAYLMSHPDFSLGLEIYLARLTVNEGLFYRQEIAKREAFLQPHIYRIRIGKPLVSACFLQNRGVKPGKKMGLLLNEAEKISINQNINDPVLVFSQLEQLPLWKEEFA